MPTIGYHLAKLATLNKLTAIRRATASLCTELDTFPGQG
jgi:hypothetical protein